MNIETKLILIVRLLIRANVDFFFATRFQEARNKIGVFHQICCYDKDEMARLLKLRRRHSENAVSHAAHALAILSLPL